MLLGDGAVLLSLIKDLAEMFLKSIVRKRKHNRSNVSFFVQKQRLKSKRLLNQILVTISLGFFLYNKKQFL